MSYSAQVFRILIASPSDVTTEREIAVRTIQEWNDLNSAERQIVLLPLRWETHSAPEFGNHPQDIINRQVVDRCDLLVGIFWTRIGTPTEKADSGTLEEIERVAESGKPVMLYFSRAKQNPEDIDVEQLTKLRAFKDKTLPNALIYSYDTHIEFRDQLSKQLEIQLRQILAEEAEASSGGRLPRPVTDIQFQFADPESGSPGGENTEKNSKYIVIGDFEKIPDYSPSKAEAQKVPEQSDPNLSFGNALTGKFRTLYFKESAVNENYYRQLLTRLVQRNFFVPIRFWFKNIGGIGARDIYVDIQVRSTTADIVVVKPDEIPSGSPSTTRETWGLLGAHSSFKSRPEEVMESSSRSWGTSIELRALQPQREISPPTTMLVGSEQSTDIEVRARIFADTLAEPETRVLTMRLDVDRIEANASEILADMVPAGVE